MNIGERVGDYEIVAILGSGGMGQVYKVRNVISERVEAMKVLLPNLGSDTALADRFLREIKVQATLDHPNIARLNTAQQVGNQLIMLMEYVEGSSIDTLLKSGPMELSECLQCTSQVLDALSYAHAHGVVHRDIKPANIMRTPSGVVKLMDFGIARIEADRPLTRTGTTVGSLFYMSPEQIHGGQPDLRSDLYSMGVTLYEMVTGRRPFQGDSDYSIMAAHLEQKPVAPIEIVAGVPLDLNDIIMMAISKEPEQRFQSADAFHAALRNFAKSIGVPLGAQPAIAKPMPVALPPSQPSAPQLAPTATGISVPVRPAPMVTPVAPPPTFQPQAAPLPAEYQARPPVPAAPAFQTPPMPPPTATKSGSRRGLYMALGSVATLLVLAAAVIEGPKLMHSGASSAAPRTDAPAESKAESTFVPATPPPPAAPAPEPAAQPAASAPVQTPVEATPTPTPVPAPRNAPTQKAASGQSPAAQPRAAQPPAQQPPVAQQPPATQQQPPQQSSQQPAKPSAAEMNEIRQQYNQVAIRVGAAKSGLRGLQQQMQRQGLDMRGDILEAESRMDYLMQESMGSLRGGDPDAARSSLQMAERSLETIEKFLGR
ncbi:MAG TPA: protein kinase [Bryobacteraceae bacterium]|nr:protein kinase [Bryobacteraceae bacterium]